MTKRIVVAVALVAALVVPLAAQYAVLEQVTVGATAVGFTAATINAGSGHPEVGRAICRVRTAEISARWDGGTPTASVGTLFYVGDVIDIKSPLEVKRFLAIRTTSTSGQLDCTLTER